MAVGSDDEKVDDGIQQKMNNKSGGAAKGDNNLPTYVDGRQDDDGAEEDWDLMEEMSSGSEDSLQQSLLLGSPLKGRRRRSRSMPPWCRRIRFIVHIFPFLGWLPKYTRDQFVSDLLGGLTVAVMVIPQGMSYAVLAELPPVYGLFCACSGPFVYAFLGTSKVLSIGPVALVSLSLPRVYELLGILDDGMTDEEADAARVKAAMSISFVAGSVLLALSVLRLGRVSHFIPPAVMSGFTNAAALSIGISQIKELLGIKVPNYDYTWQSCVFVLSHLQEGQLASAIMGLFCILFLLGAKQAKARLDKSAKQSTRDWMKIIYPVSNLAIVVITAIIAYILIYQGIDINVVKSVPAGLPTPSLPDLSQYWFIMGHIVSTIVLVAFMEAYAIATKYALQEKYPLDVNHELTALGAANLVGSFFSAYPVSGSFSRTAVSYSAGTRTQMANVVSGLFVMVTIRFLARFFYYIPRATLGAIIEVALINLIDLKSIKKEYKRSPCDLIVAIVTFIVTLAFDTEYGLTAGLSTSLLLLYWMPRGGALLVRLWVRPSLARRQACDVVIISLARLHKAPPRIWRRVTDYLNHHRRARGASPHIVVILDGEDLESLPTYSFSASSASASPAHLSKAFVEKVIRTIEKGGVPGYMVVVVGLRRGGSEEVGLGDVLSPAQLQACNEVSGRAHSVDSISVYGAGLAARG